MSVKRVFFFPSFQAIVAQGDEKIQVWSENAQSDEISEDVLIDGGI